HAVPSSRCLSVPLPSGTRDHRRIETQWPNESGQRSSCWSHPCRSSSRRRRQRYAGGTDRERAGWLLLSSLPLRTSRELSPVNVIDSANPVFRRRVDVSLIHVAYDADEVVLLFGLG